MLGFADGVTVAILLGAGLLILGAVGALYSGETTTVIDPSSRTVTLAIRRRFFGGSEQHFSFDDVASVGVSILGGTRSHGAVTPIGRYARITYLLKLGLKDGRSISTGKWSKDEHEMYSLAEQVAAMIGCASQEPLQRFQLGVPQMLNAAIGAVFIYALWYRIAVGPWCPAMWYGASPLVIMAGGFLTLLWVQQLRLWRYLGH